MNFCLMEPNNAMHEDLYHQLTRRTKKLFQRLPVFQTFDLRLLDKVELCVHMHHANNQFLDFSTTNWLLKSPNPAVIYDPEVLAKFDAVLLDSIDIPTLPTTLRRQYPDPVEFPAVSIVTLTYNRPQLVPLMKQSLPATRDRHRFVFEQQSGWRHEFSCP